MIAGLSKAITLHLATLLSLTSILLLFFAFFAPVLLLEDRVALLSVVPSTVLQNKTSDASIDGPTIHIGALGTLFLNAVNRVIDSLDRFMCTLTE